MRLFITFLLCSFAITSSLSVLRKQTNNEPLLEVDDSGAVLQPSKKEEVGGYTVSKNYDPHGQHMHKGTKARHAHDGSFNITPMQDDGDKRKWPAPAKIVEKVHDNGNGLIDRTTSGEDEDEAKLVEDIVAENKYGKDELKNSTSGSGSTTIHATSFETPIMQPNNKYAANTEEEENEVEAAQDKNENASGAEKAHTYTELSYSAANLK
eukprot:g1664.t1